MNKFLKEALLIHFRDRYPGLSDTTITSHITAVLKLLDMTLPHIETLEISGNIPTRELLVYTAYLADNQESIFRG